MKTKTTTKNKLIKNNEQKRKQNEKQNKHELGKKTVKH